jgi:hypothetical protein
MTFERSAAGALVAAVLFTMSSAPLRAVADGQTAQLITQSGGALGVAALARVSTVRTDATLSALGLHGTETQWIDLKDGRMAEITKIGPYAQLDGYDGHIAWAGDATGLVWKQGGDADVSTEIDQAYLATYALWKPDADGALVTSLGAKIDKGRTFDVLSVQPRGSRVPLELWFDQTTHLPARSVIAGSTATAVTSYSDYQAFHGVMIAKTIHTDSSDGNNSDGTLTNVAVDPADAGEHLNKPDTHPADFSMLGGKTSTSIPIEIIENHVYLDVMLNGQGPFRFIFDTGGQNVVDPEVAKAIGAVGHGTAQGGGVGDTTESLSFAMVKREQVGDALLRDQLFAIAPTRQGFGMAAGKPIDGLIGWEVLARYVTTFDYANRRVVLAMPPASAQNPPGAHVVPFVLYGTQPQIACTIDAIPSECTIDTGARDTISFMRPWIEAHPQAVPATLTAAGVTGFGFGGAATGKLGRVREIGIDDLQVNDAVGDFSTQTAGAFSVPFVAANIGGGLLRRFTVTFDYNRETMALVPNADYAKPDVYERGGLFIINRGGAITVIDARPGTPAAAAGIAKGDVITAVDGVATSTMTLGQIRDVFFEPAGTVVKLDLKAKDGGTRSVSLTLRDFV